MTITKSIREIRSQVFTTAWFYFHKGIYTTDSQCLKVSWKAYRIKSRLKKGVLNITSRKAAGEIRRTLGALNVPDVYFVKKEVIEHYNPNIIKYLDRESYDWRTFRRERFINLQNAA